MTQWYEIENADEISSPALLVYPDRIAQNLQRMIDWVGGAQKLRPHVKTHKMPQVIRMKLDAGITKFKASTIAEVEMTVEAGGKDVLLSYQPVGPVCKRLVELASRFPDATISTIVDNKRSLEELSEAATERGQTIPVFIDLNVGMNRTGIPIGEEARSLYQAMLETQGIETAGMHAYDGHLHLSDYEELCKQAEQTFEPVWRFRDELMAANLNVPTIVTSGTPTSKFVANSAKASDSAISVEVSAGTMALWDRGYTELCPQYDFQCAAVLLARVISCPSEGLLCVDVGYKAVASESPHPRIYFLGLEEAEAVGHSEEHLVLKTARANEFNVGSLLYGIPHHICPTVALHQEVWCVRDNQAVEAWPVIARDRRISV